MISISTSLRKEALPAQQLISLILGRTVLLVSHEDNSATISSIKAGYSPALRHLSRTERISLGVLNEVYFGPGSGAQLRHCPTLLQKGDLFTKVLDEAKFSAALELFRVFGLSSR